MSTNYWKYAVAMAFGLVFTSPAQAATKGNSGSGSNSFLFIENNVDNEYFVTPNALDPRFSGANMWTRYSTAQVSLGYMGNIGWVSPNTYTDMWIENSSISRPFQGIRCMTSGNTCPSSGYIAGEIIDDHGFYHTKAGNSIYNGSYGLGSLSPEAYEYFRKLPVGSSETFEINWCHTTTNYDYSDGTRCKDITTGGAYWRYYNFTLNKIAHLTLNSTNSIAEIWIASDGTPSIAPGSNLCQITKVNNVDGVTCKMVSYTYQQSAAVTNYLDMAMVLDTNMLGFTPTANSDIRFSGDGSTWYNYTTQNTDFNKIITTGGDSIYLFLTTSFFKQALAKGNDLTNRDSLFTFNFNNDIVGESGYYQFTPSNRITIVPKEYGISIVSADGSSHPTREGKIDSDQPIEFEYTITTSASRQADSINVQVKGDSVRIRDVPYCVFTSADESLSVPIPAYLSYTSSSGATVTARNSCTESPIDITNAKWVQTAWNANLDDSYFFTTNVKLLFPMNDSRSQFTVSGEDWMGTVSASGEIVATATWIGVN